MGAWVRVNHVCSALLPWTVCSPLDKMPSGATTMRYALVNGVLVEPVTSEKHIADVKTEHGQVIEFQHSLLEPEELKSREAFYKNLVWVVDGCRGELDAATFNLGLGTRQDPPNHPTTFDFSWYGRSKLFANWWAANCPVFIDFGQPVVWRLALYDPKKKRGVVGPMEREGLVQVLIEGRQLGKIPPKA